MAAFRPCQRGGPDVSWRLVNTTVADGDRLRGKASLLRPPRRVNAAGITGHPLRGVPTGYVGGDRLDSPALDRSTEAEGGGPSLE